MISPAESGHHRGTWEGLLELMHYLKIPVTRENYLNLEFFGNPPHELTPEQEDELPPALRKTHSNPHGGGGNLVEHALKKFGPVAARKP